LDNLKWLFGVLLIAVCIGVGFLIGKSYYDLPIPAVPDPVVNIDTVYVDTSMTIDVEVVKRDAFHKGYLTGIGLPRDTLYHLVDSLAIFSELIERYGDEIKTTFTSDQTLFTAQFVLFSTIDIRSYLTTQPKFSFQYKKDLNELFYTEYNAGYSLGYKEGRSNIPFWKKLEYAAYGAGTFFIVKSTIDLVKGQ